MAGYRHTTERGSGIRGRIVERCGGAVLLAIVLIFAVAVGAVSLLGMAPRHDARGEAIAAADSVSRTADKAGDAVDRSQ